MGSARHVPHIAKYIKPDIMVIRYVTSRRMLMGVPIITTGDASVIDAFYDTDPNRRLGIVTCAGGNRNAKTAGAFISLRQRKLTDRPDAFAGVSSGIATTGFFMGRGIAPDVKVFSDDMSDRRMFDLRRRFRGRYPFDVDYVERVFRGIETGRGIRAHVAVSHGSPLYAVLGDAITGEPIIRKPADAEDLWTLASYGTAVTGFARPLTYQGQAVTDGYFTVQQLPVEWLVENEQLTDVLVFAGGDYDPQPQLSHWSEHALYASGIASATGPIRDLIRTRNIRFMETADRIVQLPHVRVLMVWVPERLSPLNIKKEKSRALVRLGYQTMEALFRQRHL